MHDDPTQWSLDDVQTWFRECASTQVPLHKRILELAESQDSIYRIVEDNGLDGQTFLEEVDIRFVRKQNLSTALEIAIRKCADHLRGVSKAHYSASQVVKSESSPPFQPPHEDVTLAARVSTHHVQRTIESQIDSSVPPPPLQHNQSLVLTPSQSHTVDSPRQRKLPASFRAGSTTFGPSMPEAETISTTRPYALVVDDSRPVKRRRVQPHKVSPNITVTEPPASKVVGKVIFDVNDVFYGRTIPGHPIEEQSDDDDTQWEAIRPRQDSTQTRLVNRRMRYFLQHQMPFLTQFKDAQAVYIQPYPIALTRTPSVSLFYIDKIGHCVASRQNVQPTLGGFSILGAESHVPDDQYSKLLVKYGGQEEDEVLPLLTSDEAGGYFASSDEDDAVGGGSDDDEAEEDNSIEPVLLSRDVLQSMLDVSYEETRQKWHRVMLPKLEEKQARNLWRRHKGNPRLRDELVVAAQRDTENLQKRLHDEHEWFIQRASHTDMVDARRAADAMSPTIHDILKSEWSIEVYQRPRKPAAPPPRAIDRTIRRPLTFSHHDSHELNEVDNSDSKADDEINGFRVSETVINNSTDVPDDELSPRSAKKQEVIEIISDTEDETAAVVIHKSPSPSMKPSQKRLQRQVRPLDMRSEEVKALNFEDLCRTSDRLRILIVLLSGLSVQDRNDIYHECILQQASFEDRLVEALNDLVRLGLAPRLELCVDLLLAWFYRRDLSIDSYAYPVNDVQVLIDSPQDISRFTRSLQDCIRLKDSKLFEQMKPAKPIFDLSSEDDGMPRGPKRKENAKAAAYREAGEAKRKAARERQSQHQASQASQTLNSSQLSSHEHIGASSLMINNSSDANSAIFINQHAAEKIKPHQIKGVQFMWRELTSDHEEEVNGCLLAHTMGLGKTMQTIVVLVTLAETILKSDTAILSQLPPHLASKHGTTKQLLRAMILCPPTIIDNWCKELADWDRGRVLGELLPFDVEKRDELVTLQRWKDHGGVLIAGYQKFAKRVMEVDSAKHPHNPASSHDRNIKQLLTQTADIVVLDEAQAIKNHNSKTSQAVANINARSRIVLSGTPLSNAVDEVYELINFVSPGYFGSRAEFTTRFATPIKAGLYADASKNEQRRALLRLAVLRREIEPKYERADHAALVGSLPSKVEFMITVDTSEQQKAAYIRLTQALSKDTDSDAAKRQATIFSCLQTLSVLLTHPAAFRKKLLTLVPIVAKKSKQSADDDFSDSEAEYLDATTISPNPTDPGDGSRFCLPHHFTQAMAENIIGDITSDTNALLSARTALFLEIVRKCVARGDKVLVFSHFLPTTYFLEALLETIKIKCSMIHGKIKIEERLKRLAQFEKGRFDVILISTRAGGVGLNMQCANRVIIMDSSFNPTHEQQAVGRAYRFGQQKPVWVYHFMAGGTFEDKMHNMQEFKTSQAQRVIDKKDYMRRARVSMEEWLLAPRTPLQNDISQWREKDPGVMDDIIEAQLSNPQKVGVERIYAMETTETMHIDDNERLDEQEQQSVDAEVVENNKVRRSARQAKRHGAAPSHQPQQHATQWPNQQFVQQVIP